VSDILERYRARRSAWAEAPSRCLDPAPTLREDTLWRGLTRNGELRLLVARATATTSEIARTLGAHRDGTRLLANLVLGGVLARSTLDPDAQLQITIRDRGPAGRLYLDVWPSGRGLRASVEHPAADLAPKPEVLPGGELEIVRSRGGGTPYRSSRNFEEKTLPQLFEIHLLESDQIVSMLRLDVRSDGDDLALAAGFLVQVTPEGTREDLARLVANLDALPALGGAMTESDPDARAWVDRLLAGYRWDQSAREPIGFVCRCSRDRLLAILGALPGGDLDELIEAGEPIETTCEFCRARYEIDPAELAARRRLN
jgi:molecular chaperone Hsp33